MAIAAFGDVTLFCWGDNDFIQCCRMVRNELGKNISSITYKLNVPGSNSIFGISTTESYEQLFFSNTNSGKTRLYEYLIYFPSCKNLTYTIIVYHSVNEEKGDTEKDDFIERKTNTAYYVEFNTLPDKYGDLKINGEKIISGKNTKILLEKDKSYILDFNSTNNNSVKNFKIRYGISISENYSATCSMDLTILPCYDSCARCSKDNSSSSSDNHNCLVDKCKSGYYPSPLILTNCIKEEEK